jgi:hypothetical protein
MREDGNTWEVDLADERPEKNWRKGAGLSARRDFLG